MARKEKGNRKIAPAMEEELNRRATKEEKRKGDTTPVTALSWDEVEND